MDDRHKLPQLSLNVGPNGAFFAPATKGAGRQLPRGLTGSRSEGQLQMLPAITPNGGRIGAYPSVASRMPPGEIAQRILAMKNHTLQQSVSLPSL